MLKVIEPSSIAVTRKDPLDEETLNVANVIVEDVKANGDSSLRALAEKFGDIEAEQELRLGKAQLEQAFNSIPVEQQSLLKRVAKRIENFAQAQRESFDDLEFKIPGGSAGHSAVAVDRAGCYAPGGRFPLPSTVLMTAITARVAGVSSVTVASPKPAAATLAAAFVAGADEFIAAGGAQVIAALAYGTESILPCDVIVGPGNRFVTAAKKIVSGRVRIDMLAGPSELVVIADDTANPEIVAADLLAQAEHDPDALPILISLSAGLLESVNQQLAEQLETLPTKDTASEAVQNGFAVLVSSPAEAAEVSNSLAPEHLELIVGDLDNFLDLLKHYGALFLGEGSAEVLGDYGAGPNHTLPTSGTARSVSGLSVLNFLKFQTWLKIDDPDAAKSLIEDSAALGKIEGLEAHARAAQLRK